jgi:hypothetical protein
MSFDQVVTFRILWYFNNDEQKYFEISSLHENPTRKLRYCMTWHDNRVARNLNSLAREIMKV